MRVHEAAKKYKIKSEEIIDLLAKKGLTLKSHMSSVTDEMIAVLEQKTKGAKSAKPKAKAAKAKTKKKADAKPTTAARPKPAAKTTPPAAST